MTKNLCENLAEPTGFVASHSSSDILRFSSALSNTFLFATTPEYEIAVKKNSKARSRFTLDNIAGVIRIREKTYILRIIVFGCILHLEIARLLEVAKDAFNRLPISLGRCGDVAVSTCGG